MPHISKVTLSVNLAQRQRLLALQTEFANACNFVAPIARQNRCWHRVTLHHLSYRALREKFPDLGAQMACNAIYAVCRAYRMLYQLPNTPWANSEPDALLPLIRFAQSAPVYFDRHTLTVKPGSLSLFTMEGRLRFQLQLEAQFAQRFAELRLREVVLLNQGDEYSLQFSFLDQGEVESSDSLEEWPEYLVTLDPLLQDSAMPMAEHQQSVEKTSP
jgi:predicted transposase